MKLALFAAAVLLCSAVSALAAREGQLVITVVDRDTNKPIACRMHLKNSRGRPHKARKAPFWHDHFAIDGTITLRLPLGNYTFELERGPEYLIRSGHFRIENFADDAKTVDMKRFVDMSEFGWWSGDIDVRRDVKDIELLMRAEDLHVAEVLTWRNDEDSWRGRTLKPEELLVRFDKNRYYQVMGGLHERAGTGLLFFNLPKPMPAADGEYPPSAHFAENAHEQRGGWVDLSKPFGWDLPMLVANRQIDSIQIAHSNICRDSLVTNESGGKDRDVQRYPNPWGNARWSQQIYFHLLNCGLRIPPTAGSGSGEAANPLGYNRMYVHVDGQLTYEKWFNALNAGRVTITNGPLLRPTVEGQLPGYVFHADKGKTLDLEIGLTLSTRQPISYLEIIKDGKVVHSIPMDEYAKSGRLPKLSFDRSGWFLVRAVTDLRTTYRFAMTGPYYVEIGYEPRISKSSAEFFYQWVFDRARQIKIEDKEERRKVLGYHMKARDFWKDLVDRANAE